MVSVHGPPHGLRMVASHLCCPYVNIGVPQTGFEVAAILPGLLRTHRRMLPGTSRDPVTPSNALAETSGQGDGSNESKAIAQETTDNSSKGDRVASDSVVRQSSVGVGGVGGGEELHGNEEGGMTAGDNTTVSDTAAINNGVGKGKGLGGGINGSAAERNKGLGDSSGVEGNSARGNSFDVTDEAAPTRPSGDDDGRTSSAKNEGIDWPAGGEAGRSRDGVVDTAIPNGDPTFSRQENREETGGRDDVSNLTTQARGKQLPVGSGRRTAEGGAAVSGIVGKPDAAGNTAVDTGTAPDELFPNPERGDTPAAAKAQAAAAAAAAAASSVHSSLPGDASETVGDRSAVAQRGDAVVGLESAAQSASDPSTRESLAVVAVDGEGEVNTPRGTEADPSDHDDGAAVRSEEKDAGQSNTDAIGPQAYGNASTPSAEKPPAKSTWGWGLPAWAGGGKNNGAR